VIKFIKNQLLQPEKKILFGNFFSLSVLQVANYILPLITFPYLVRVLGVEYFGLLAFATATVTYFSILTDYGFNLTATREISIHREDKNKVTEIFSSVMTIKFALMFISFVLLTILVFSFKKFRTDWLIYYFSFGMVIGQTLFPVWFFQGMEKMKYITYMNILAKTIFTIAIFVFVKQQSDFLFVPMLSAIGSIFAGFWSLIIIYRGFKIKFKWQKKTILLYHLKEAYHIFINNIAISLYTVSTTFILGLLTSNIIVGYFAAANKIVQAFKMLLTPITQSFYPFISKRFSVAKKSGFIIIQHMAYSFTFGVGILCLIIFIFANNIITLLLGEAYFESIILLQIMSFLPVIIFLSNLFAVQGLYALGKQKIVSAFLIKIAAFHLVYSTLSIVSFGIYGATISLVFTEVLITVFSIVEFNKIKKEVLV
jgi:polysaccharide transporter, PST family